VNFWKGQLSHALNGNVHFLSFSEQKTRGFLTLRKRNSMILLFQGCSAKKRSVGTAIPKRSGNTKQKGLVTLFPHQVQSKIPPNVSNEVSIRLSEFPLLSMMSQTVIAQPCYGASDAIACHLFIYSAPSASSNVASAKRCGNAFPHEKKVWERRSHPTTPLFYFNCRIG